MDIGYSKKDWMLRTFFLINLLNNYQFIIIIIFKDNNLN